MKTALICGVTGQDGAYLAQFLLNRDYIVVGTSRDADEARLDNLKYLGIADRVRLETMALNDFRSVLQVMAKTRPSEVYNLAGQSSVGLSFERPVEALESIAGGTVNLLEAIRFLDPSIRFYNAGSSECFGNTGVVPADETTPFRPRSPYAAAKAFAANLVANYREAYKIAACTGFLFNHESPLRPARFVTRKIVQAAHRISVGEQTAIRLGNLDISRDWGWAPDYVEAMWLLINREYPIDVIIATGRTVTLEYFVMKAFAHFNLDWQQHVIFEPGLMRPADISYSAGNPQKAALALGWSATYHVDDVVRAMCTAESNSDASRLKGTV